MIDPEEAPAQQESGEDPPCYAPRGDFLIGLAQETPFLRQETEA